MSNKTKSTESPSHPIDSTNRLERRKQRRKNRGSGTAVADWQSVDPNILQSLIAAVTQFGTITFGYTRDGGAYYINYWVDGQSDKEYIRPTEDVDQALESELESWK